MKTATDVLPLLLNILLKTPMTQLLLPRLHTLIIFTATAKQSSFTNSLFPYKKAMNTQCSKRPGLRASFSQPFHLDKNEAFPVILVRHPIRIFSDQSHTRSRFGSPLGSEEVKTRAMGLIQFLKKAMERLSRTWQCLIRFWTFVKHCTETFRSLKMGEIIKS